MLSSQLEPCLVWSLFERITRIPRPSKKEGKIRAFLEEFASDLSLEYKTDSKGNLVIVRPASAGREGEEAVILQSHMDMVCEKEPAVDFDFDTDPIQPYIEDGWVRAKGTTLGADCGIGMALQMAVLADRTLSVPRIEALFTVDEEQGLSGAMELGTDMLTGTRMINLDSEDEGEVFIGCAGGIDTIATFDYTPEQVANTQAYTYYIIGVSGLQGGHSGDDIEKGRGNSNKILGRILWTLHRALGVRVAQLDGGNLRNAIPRDAKALVAIPAERAAEAERVVAGLAEELVSEYKYREPGLKIGYSVAPTVSDTVLPHDLQRRLLDALYAVPHGVMAMSLSIPGLVETSTNLASVKMSRPGQIVVTTSQRSSVESAKRDIAAQVASVFELAGADVRHTDGYPGWTPNPDSALVCSADAIYRELFGVAPKIKAIHAGLECGLFLAKYPYLDIISIGPTLRNVHSPAERLEIESVEKTWIYLRSMLERI